MKCFRFNFQTLKLTTVLSQPSIQTTVLTSGPCPISSAVSEADSSVRSGFDRTISISAVRSGFDRTISVSAIRSGFDRAISISAMRSGFDRTISVSAMRSGFDRTIQRDEISSREHPDNIVLEVGGGPLSHKPSGASPGHGQKWPNRLRPLSGAQTPSK